MTVMSFYSHHFLNIIQDHRLLEVKESKLEDELLVKVPGSAYSLANSKESGDAA